jgi:nitrite reductase/ring-hydroxylating ferredoxin subunit
MGVRIGAARDLKPGTFSVADASGRRIVVYNVGGSYYATDERCAHRGGPLGEGVLEGAVVTCPWHAWQFDVRTGEAIFDPGVRVQTYPVRVEGDDIFVEV